jgi:hypothetical protein
MILQLIVFLKLFIILIVCLSQFNNIIYFRDRLLLKNEQGGERDEFKGIKSEGKDKTNRHN